MGEKVVDQRPKVRFYSETSQQTSITKDVFYGESEFASGGDEGHVGEPAAILVHHDLYNHGVGVRDHSHVIDQHTHNIDGGTHSHQIKSHYHECSESNHLHSNTSGNSEHSHSFSTVNHTHEYYKMEFEDYFETSKANQPARRSSRRSRSSRTRRC